MLRIQKNALESHYLHRRLQFLTELEKHFLSQPSDDALPSLLSEYGDVSTRKKLAEILEDIEAGEILPKVKGL